MLSDLDRELVTDWLAQRRGPDFSSTLMDHPVRHVTPLCGAQRKESSAADALQTEELSPATGTKCQTID